MTATGYVSKSSVVEFWPPIVDTISEICNGVSLFTPALPVQGETRAISSHLKSRNAKSLRKKIDELFSDDVLCEKQIEIKPIDELSSDVTQIIDDNCRDRINIFREYEEGWDLGRGKQLSPASLAVFELFVRSFNSFQTDPSVFLTHDGYLQLAWEDSNGSDVEIDFLPDGLDCYIDSLDYEDVTPLLISDIESLVNKLKSI